MKKTLIGYLSIALATVMMAFATPSGAATGIPDCSNVAPDSRLAGCNGIADFAIGPVQADNGRADDNQDNRNYPGRDK